MFKKLKIVALLLIQIIAPQLFAGILFTGEKTSEAPDTSNVVISEEMTLSTEDSLLLFPAYDIYSQWDTTTIHPYKFSAVNFNDTVEVLLQDEFNCGYAHPFPGPVTSSYGSRRGRPHYGIDINLETGDTVVSAFEGMVRIAKLNKTYGNVVIIRHKNGLETIYAHLSKICVEAGQIVEPGQIIGLGGNTGRSYGSHLHFEVRYKGMPINPSTLISFEDYKLVSEKATISKSSFQFFAQQKSLKYHTVRKGDTLYKIAKRYGTTPQKICKLNRIKSSTKLRIGSKIRYS
ncbi:MAG: peptidoglycan DD-metalloendopeptidase family protein [Bacteroidetes bacterium]|nr:peptidoglycan DD-metalloendopeptidase family protein [Bacteroidota bacterium]